MACTLIPIQQVGFPAMLLSQTPGRNELRAAGIRRRYMKCRAMQAIGSLELLVDVAGALH